MSTINYFNSIKTLAANNNLNFSRGEYGWQLTNSLGERVLFGCNLKMMYEYCLSL